MEHGRRPDGGEYVLAKLCGESAACSMAAMGTDLIELVVSFARHFEVCTLHPPTAWALDGPVRDAC